MFGLKNKKKKDDVSSNSESKKLGYYSGTRVELELEKQKNYASQMENSGYVGLFDEKDLDLTPTAPKSKSVAKTYGTKYVSNGRQIASSIVVDVRSYVKKEDKVPEKKSSGFDFSGGGDFSKPDNKPKRSFFDDLLKELEEDENKEKLVEDDEDVKVNIREEVKPAQPKKKTNSSAPRKKKKSIDIDIISGDFGGSDII